MENQTIQVQAVLYRNEKENLIRSLDLLANAVRFDRSGAKYLGKVTLFWGDASPEPLFSDSELDGLQKKYPDVTLRYSFFHENTGYGKGHNRMAKEADSDFLLIENPDILICPDFFLQMLSPFAQAEVGLTEARQTPIEHPKKYDPKTLETKWSSGACFVIRTAFFTSLGGFDDRSFFMYSEDVDLSLRIRRTGKKLIYQPAAPVYHAKKLDSEGVLSHTKTELRHSAEAQMVMAYKWKQSGLLRRLTNVFESGDEYQRAAASSFRQRLANKELTQIDGDTSLYRESDFENRFNL